MLMLIKMGSMTFIFLANGLKGRTEQGKVGTEEEQPACQGKKVKEKLLQNMVFCTERLWLWLWFLHQCLPPLFTKSQGCFV